MVKNLDIELKNLDKTLLKTEDEKVFTIKEAVTQALIIAKEEGKVDGEASYKRYKLANKLFAGGEQELTPEELVLIKRMVALVYSPLVIGQVYDWADE